MYEILQIVILVLLIVLLAGVALTFRSARWINRRISSLNESVSELAPFVWATASLNQRLEIGRSLPNWNVWSMPPDTLVQILEIIERRKPKLVVEFGSGISTIVIASKLRDVGGKLISYEHDAEYAENVRHGLTERGLDRFVDLRIRSITSTKFLEYDHRWYDVDLDELPKNADLVVIDGPPMPLGKEIRLPAGDLMAERLNPGGSILFDDAKREGEQSIKRFLMKKYPGFKYLEPPAIRGMLIMSKPE